MIWGFAGVWPAEFGIYDGDRTMNKLRFVVEQGFSATQVSLREMQEPERREQIASLVEAHDLRLVPHFRADYFSDDMDEVRRQSDAFLADLEEYAPLLRAPIVTTAVGPYHRFMDEPSLEAQMDWLHDVLGPVAAACHEMGVPLGIENHGDYYCSDLVELCERTPHLGIFLDTGNTYLIGEQSVPACRAAAPYTVGTHFKDHYVHPDPRELKFVIEGAALGEGHVGLARVYRDLLEHVPDPDDLVMLWEMVSPRDMDPFECLERSWRFVRSLEEFQAGQ
ncbi:MAG: sugar phosphate isomerase/epimerase family protein [Candidatus Brocadiia bacterium]